MEVVILSPLNELHQLLDKYSLEIPTFVATSLLTQKGKMIQKGSFSYSLREFMKKRK